MATSETRGAPASQRTVTTVHGNRYRLGRLLGQGGQGTVHAVEGERLAVKLLRDVSLQSRERLRDQLAMVGRLPLEDLAVARPLEHLRPPDVGYLMELFTGMVPLRALLRPPGPDVPVDRWYVEGGGLARRLRLLARAAEVFAEIHGRGLVYVDPSPDNVFVSEAVGALEVRLIDTDNLRTASTLGRTLYTPGYGAPEVVSGSAPPSSLADAYAFAVMAFEALSLVHPFLGDAVQDGEPELEERALAGGFPWIEDPEDTRNRSAHGIDRDVVLSEQLRDAFRATFGAGRGDPLARPGMTRWAEALHRAADRTLRCARCGGTFYSKREACPWCSEQRAPFLMGAILLWDPEALVHRGQGVVEPMAGAVRDASGKPRIVDAVALSAGEPVVLTSRVALGTSGRAPKLRVTVADQRLTLEALDREPWRLVSTDGHRERDLGQGPVDIALGPSGAGWTLHAGPTDQLHRFLRFDHVAGGAR